MTARTITYTPSRRWVKIRRHSRRPDKTCPQTPLTDAGRRQNSCKNSPISRQCPSRKAGAEPRGRILAWWGPTAGSSDQRTDRPCPANWRRKEYEWWTLPYKRERRSSTGWNSSREHDRNQYVVFYMGGKAAWSGRSLGRWATFTDQGKKGTGQHAIAPLMLLAFVGSKSAFDSNTSLAPSPACNVKAINKARWLASSLPHTHTLSLPPTHSHTSYLPAMKQSLFLNKRPVRQGYLWKQWHRCDGRCGNVGWPCMALHGRSATLSASPQMQRTSPPSPSPPLCSSPASRHNTRLLRMVDTETPCRSETRRPTRTRPCYCAAFQRNNLVRDGFACFHRPSLSPAADGRKAAFVEGWPPASDDHAFAPSPQNKSETASRSHGYSPIKNLFPES